MTNAVPSRNQRKSSWAATPAKTPSKRKLRTSSLPFRPMAAEAKDVVTMDKIVALCKRRGFIFQSSEIYGGLASTYDYGHYGVLLKQNVKGEWIRAMIQSRDDIEIGRAS